VVDRAEPADMTVDRHIIGGIGEDQRRALRAHQSGESGRIKRVGARHDVVVQVPYIADLGDRRGHRQVG
jgi:hypothetical protein